MTTTSIKTTITRTTIITFQKCDCCAAKAQYRATFSFGELDFCAHHFHDNKKSLETSGASITKLGDTNEN